VNFHHICDGTPWPSASWLSQPSALSQGGRRSSISPLNSTLMPSPLLQRTGRCSTRDTVSSCGLVPIPLLRSSALSHHHEWGPEVRMGLFRLAPVDEGEHGAAQGFGAAEPGIAGDGADGRGDQLHGGGRVDRPVRHEQCASAGVDEGPRQARECLSACRTAPRVGLS